MHFRLSFALLAAAGTLLVALLPTLASAQEAYMVEALRLVNEFRAQQGVGPLCLEQKLTQAAQQHSNDMASRSFLDHTGSDGSSPFDRMRRNGYTFTRAAENIAFGGIGGRDDYSKPAAPVQAWINSAGHRENLLGSTRQMGIAMTVGRCVGFSGQCGFWTQTFGTSAANLPCMGGGSQPPTGTTSTSSSTRVSTSTPAAPPTGTPTTTASPTQSPDPLQPTATSSTSAPSPTPTPPPPTSGVDPRIVEGLQLVNDFRAQNGRAPLCLEQRMIDAAMVHSQDMARRRVMSHAGGDGSSPFDRIRRTGFPMSSGAENIAQGSLSSGARTDFSRMTGPMSLWVNSSGHRTNLLSANTQFLGIGVATGACPSGSGQCAYWTQTFASSRQSVQCLNVGGAGDSNQVPASKRRRSVRRFSN
ncbi:CAP domain-containing protein, partial [Catenaria anguillulae PL171]